MYMNVCIFIDLDRKKGTEFIEKRAKHVDAVHPVLIIDP